jgi:hypothetical protein
MAGLEAPETDRKNHEKVTRVWFGMGSVNHDFNLKFQACQSQIHLFLEMCNSNSLLSCFGVVNDEFRFRNSESNCPVSQ